MKKCGGGWDNANMREEEGCGKDMNTHIYIIARARVGGEGWRGGGNGAREGKGEDGGASGTERGREKARMEGSGERSEGGKRRGWRGEGNFEAKPRSTNDGTEGKMKAEVLLRVRVYFAASARVFCCECGVICLRVRSNSLICVANLIIFHRKIINLRSKFNNLRRKLKFSYISAGKFLYKRRKILV